MQLAQMISMLKAPGPKCDEPPSPSALQVNLRRYMEANTVCYDYRNPDVITIVEETTGNPGYAKVGDVVTLEVGPDI